MITTDREQERLRIQNVVDNSKTKEERNKLGQFSTPYELAFQIIEYAKTFVTDNKKIRFLDPAIGTGSFYSALTAIIKDSRIECATGFEIDEDYFRAASRVWSGTSLKLHLADFTDVVPPVLEEHKFNLLISNPPYVRHHHLSSQQKIRLQALVHEKTGLHLSGLAGLYCYFLLLSLSWMQNNGIAAWIIPSEFMDVVYGKQIKQFLLKDVEILRIHRFNPNESQFSDALVSSVVVWFRNSKPGQNSEFLYTCGGTIPEPANTKTVLLNSLKEDSKWTVDLSGTVNLDKQDYNSLGVLFDIKRGIATGDNSFFILNNWDIDRMKIPQQFLKPILPSPRYLCSNEILADNNGNPHIERKLFLLDCVENETYIKAEYPTLWWYLEAGVKRGVNEGYLCKSRKPWYRQETRQPAPFLCSYMGRVSSERKNPFRFFLNHSLATAHNVYLLLYPKPFLQSIIDENPHITNNILQALSKISPEEVNNRGRTYGGGLQKLEPKELANVDAASIFDLLDV